MRWPGFCGPSYQPRSMNVDAERSINLYPEFVESGTGKVKTWLVGTPGLQGFVNFTVNLGGPVRALWSQNGRAFAVIGQGFYEFFAAGYGKRWGSMTNDGLTATICSNGTAGNQVFITSAGYGYIFNTSTNDFTQITDPDFPNPCTHGLFVDGYFVALLGQSRQFRISDLEDGLSWNGLDVAEMSWSSDNLRAIASAHREIWCFGEHTTEIWYDSGAANFPFQPVGGVLIEHGILAPYSAVSLDNSLFWLGADRDGHGIVWRSNGYTPVRISTHAVEYWLAQRGNLNQTVAYAYQDEGHSFYVLCIPDSHTRDDETTWVYDVATGFWHERGTWNEDTGRWEPHEGRCHCFAFGKHFVGSRTTGQVYEMSLDLFDEDVSLRDTNIETPSLSAAVGEIVVPTIGRACWFGYFYSASVRYGYNTDGIPQNCLYIEDVASVAWAVSNGYHFVVGTDDAAVLAACAGYEDWIIALMCTGGSPATLATAAADMVAARPSSLAHRPIIGICDGFLPTGAIANVDWLAIECYTQSTESAAQCQARIEASLALLDAGQEVCLIGLSYTSNTDNTQDVTQLEASQVIPANIAAADSRVQMILMFSDGRPTGTQDHEEWRPIHEDIFAGLTQPALESRSASRSSSRSASASVSPSRSESTSSSASISPSVSESISSSASISPSVSESVSGSASISESISESLSESSSPSGGG